MLLSSNTEIMAKKNRNVDSHYNTNTDNNVVFFISKYLQYIWNFSVQNKYAQGVQDKFDSKWYKVVSCQETCDIFNMCLYSLV